MVMGKSGKIPMEMAKLAPLASQWMMLDGKTNVGIGFRRVELMLVAEVKIGRGRN